jgi:DNA-binding IscR family transcriptional regulator
MEINITPQDIVEMSKDKVDECNDIFKKPLNMTEASNLLNAVLPQLEQKISDMLQEQIYDDLMDKNGGHDWIDEKLTKYLQDGDNK